MAPKAPLRQKSGRSKRLHMELHAGVHLPAACISNASLICRYERGTVYNSRSVALNCAYSLCACSRGDRWEVT